jgi:hypothetical protein
LPNPFPPFPLPDIFDYLLVNLCQSDRKQAFKEPLGANLAVESSNKASEKKQARARPK